MQFARFYTLSEEIRRINRKVSAKREGMMTDQKQREIFSKNLRLLLERDDKSQITVAKALGVKPQTFNNWVQGIALPRMGRVQQLADYFNVNKSELIDERDDRFSVENAHLVAKIRKDPELTAALHIYFELSEDKRRYVLDLISMLSQSS